MTGECPACGAAELTRVWADQGAYFADEPPDFVGCRACGELHDPGEVRP